MLNYLIPIFCFGLVITGIVILGLLEAARQEKASARELQAQRSRDDSPPVNHLPRRSTASPQRA